MDDGDHPWVMAAEAHICGSPWILWSAGWVDLGDKWMMVTILVGHPGYCGMLLWWSLVLGG